MTVSTAEVLPAVDVEFLNDRAISHEVHVDGGMVNVVFPSWGVPQGLSPANADLLVRLQPGYPDSPPDMWWFDPPVLRSDGGVPTATEVRESYLGRQWQRWSRHLQPNQWRAGSDGLETYLALIAAELRRAAA